jgi:hypothetical protein
LVGGDGSELAKSPSFYTDNLRQTGSQTESNSGGGGGSMIIAEMREREVCCVMIASR